MPQNLCNPVTHVIFDMDGLLLDTESRYENAISAVTNQFGKEYPFELKLKIMGRTGYDSAKIICEELQLPIDSDEYLRLISIEYDRVFEPPVLMMPGAERLVRHLYANRIPMAIATSSKRATFELKTRTLKHIFEIFHHILIASDDPEITRGKPDPQTFEVCAARFGTDKPEFRKCLVFEDSPAGVDGAMAAGMQCVWVPDPRLDKSIAKPTMVLNTLEEFRPEMFHLPPFNK